MSRIHKTARSIFREPSSWVAFAATFGTLGGQLDKPESSAAFIASAICAIIGVFLKSPRSTGA